MEARLSLLGLSLLCLVGICICDTNVQLPVNGNQVPVGDVGTTPSSPTTKSGDPTVTDNGEAFSGDIDGGSIALKGGKVPSESSSLDPAATEQAVAAENDPVGDLEHDQNRFLGKRRMLQSRKMLGALELGSAEDGSPAFEAGNNEAGASATAYGHGDLDGPPTDLSDNHIEPHGVEGTVTTAGTDTPYNAAANPDCAGTVGGFNEGPDCVGANVGK